MTGRSIIATLERIVIAGLQALHKPGEGNAPLLMLLHGYGADEADLFGLAPLFDDSLRVISVRAPYASGFGGYAWFGLEYREQEKWMDEELALSSRETLVDVLEELRQRFLPSKVFLGGFSQGAMMTLGIALLRPALIDAALIMSGKYLPVFAPPGEMPPNELPMLVQHGLNDPLLPIEDGREIRDKLSPMFPHMDYQEYPMDHTISGASARDATKWVEILL